MTLHRLPAAVGTGAPRDRQRSHTYAALASIVFSAWALLSCGPGSSLTPDSSTGGDARTEGGMRDEAQCTRDPDCDNGVFCDGAERCVEGRCTAATNPCDDRRSCTADRCDEEMRQCVHEADHSMCGDDNACNGVERCDPTASNSSASTGCTPVRPDNVVDCNDSNNCTIDSCDRSVGCVHAPRDLDGDGHVDRSCTVDGTDRGMQGDDCNDGDPDSYPGSPEDCADGRDNNCDGRVDLQDTTACRPSNDTCERAQALSAPGMYWGSTVGLASDLTLGCNPGGFADAVFTFTLTEPRDVTLSITTTGTNAALSLLRSCDVASEVRCNRGTSSGAPRIRARSLPAGTYFVVAETGATASAFRLSYQTTAATPVPSEDLCPAEGSTFVELADGMPHVARFADYEDDYTLSCNTAGGRRDAVFKLTLREPSDVYLRASSTTTPFSTTWLSFRGSPCRSTDTMNEIRCVNGTNTTPILLTRRAMPAGEYFVLVENSADQDVTVTAEVVSPPAPRLTEDLCPASAGAPTIDLNDGMPRTVRFAMLEDDYALSCNASAMRRDAVFSLTLRAPSDVIVRATPVSLSATSNTYLSFRTSPCDTNAGERRCAAGAPTAPPTISQRNLPPGTYWVHVENAADQDVNVQATITSPPAPRPAEDLCPVQPGPIGGDAGAPSDAGAIDGGATGLDAAAPTMDAGTMGAGEAGSTTGGDGGAAAADPPDLSDGMPRTARLMVLEDDHVLTCNAGATRRDAVYKLTVRETSDVTLRATAATGSVYLQFRADSCASSSGDRRCVVAAGTTGAVVTQRGVAPGTYWVLVENSSDADTTVQAMLTPSGPVPRYTRTENPAGVSFVDVCSLPGTLRLVASTDDLTQPLPASMVPFPVRFYGLPVTPPFSVCSNGWLSFTATTNANYTSRIGEMGDPGLLVAAAWTDLGTRTGGVCVNTVGTAPNRSIVVQWDDAQGLGETDDHLDFEIIVREAAAGQNNVIDVAYRRMDGFSRSASGGIENEDGSLFETIPMPVVAPRVFRFTPAP